MRRRRLVLLLLLAAPALAQDDVVLRAMQDELERSRALSIVSLEQPYYIEYAIEDGDSIASSATLGAVISSRHARFRLPRIRVRVGDYKFDNTNFIGSDFNSGASYGVEHFPLDNSYAVLRHHLWLATDAAYKAALEAYSRKRSALRNVTRSDDLPDFDRAEPKQLLVPVHLAAVDESAWVARIRRLSAVFLNYPLVEHSTVDFACVQSIQYLVTSEGARIRVPERALSVRVRAGTQAPDGMELRDAFVFHSPDPEHVPPEAELERGVRQVADNLTALAGAPVGEAYSGPVLFEGMASAQLFAEVLGKNLAVARRPVVPPGQPLPFLSSELEGRLGARILPEWMDVVDDPAQAEWRGHRLFGHYTVDLEGIAPQPLTLVEKGVLKNFLLTRQPVLAFTASNGHARLPGSFGAKAAGAGNLFVRASQTAPDAELKRQLIDMCRERGKPYGILVKKIDFPSSASVAEAWRLLTGMMQSGGAARPVSVPLLTYRVYTDGRGELVRGLRFRGLTARSLKDIVAASDESYVFDFLDNTLPFALMDAANYVTEVSVIAPSVLIDDLELERPQEELPKPPIVPAPPLVASQGSGGGVTPPALP